MWARFLAIVRGLSPRVRGNHYGSCFRFCHDGSIPACAGEPAPGCKVGRYHWVYPRVCGGTCYRRRPEHLGRGLSPRVRGNPVFAHTLKFGRRSIPACAGEPTKTWVVIIPPWVYPRVCGGTFSPCLFISRYQGLSPRVRGNRRSGSAHSQPRGSIPACAGEPDCNSGHLVLAEVYPRVCGGTSPKATLWIPVTGLSPRVRGNRPQGWRHWSEYGSIPACAGEPKTHWVETEANGVYPRVCGGTPF